MRKYTKTQRQVVVTQHPRVECGTEIRLNVNRLNPSVITFAKHEENSYFDGKNETIEKEEKTGENSIFVTFQVFQ